MESQGNLRSRSCFSTFDSGAWASAIASQCSGVVIAGATPIGREVASRVAAKRGIPIIQDATGLKSGITITRPIYSGKAVETSTVSGDCVITLRANAFDAAGSGGSASVNVVDQSADISIAVKGLSPRLAKGSMYQKQISLSLAEEESGKKKISLILRKLPI